MGTLSVTVDGPSKVDMDCSEVSTGYEVSYTPCVPGDYFVTVKYNGKNVEGSPFKVTATGGVGGAGAGGGQGAKNQMMQRRESSSMTMETIQRTMMGKQNSFSVDCSRAGNNVLFVGIYGPEKPC